MTTIEHLQEWYASEVQRRLGTQKNGSQGRQSVVESHGYKGWLAYVFCMQCVRPTGQGCPISGQLSGIPDNEYVISMG